MTCLVSTVLVSTFICSLDLRLPLSCAILRMRCTAAMTSACCARKALPRSVVHLMFSESCLTTSGKPRVRECSGPSLASGQRLPTVFRSDPSLGQPLLELDDLRICGRHKNNAEQRIGIKRDRSYQGIELIGGQLGRGLIRRCWSSLLWRRGPHGIAEASRCDTNDCGEFLPELNKLSCEQSR